MATAAEWSLPRPLSREVVAAVGGRLVVAGGLTRGDRTIADVYRLDPRSGSTVRLPSLAHAVHDAAGSTSGRSVLVVGGGSSAVSSDVQQVGSGPGTVVGRLPTPRADSAATTVRGVSYVVGGYDGHRPLPEVLSTTDGRAFVAAGALAQAVRYPAVASIGGRVIAVGGETPTGDTSAVQSFDPATHETRVIGHLTVARSHAVALVLGGRLWVVGGRVGGQPSNDILSLDPVTGRSVVTGHLPHAVRDAAVAVIGDTGYLLGGQRPLPTADVVRLALGTSTGVSAAGAARAVAPPPAFEGKLLIADRGNNRLLLVDAAKHILWRYPSATAPPPAGGFYFPDDAFFARKGTSIVVNQEENHTVAELSFPSGRVRFVYGKPRHPGSVPGYLNQPDDAYLLRSGEITVADAKNCRILFIDPSRGAPVRQFGTTRVCVHRPPASIGYPNGDTPLANGDFLVSEIKGSWVTELRPDGSLAWTVHVPGVRYPSDPQQLGPDLYLLADYAKPGAVVEFTREGRVVYRYRPTAGDGMLDHPSLAERFPNGLLAVNDDYRHRVVLIDPATDRIAWQYGVTGHPGSTPGYLRIPDGLDLLVGTATPTHPTTG